MARLIITADIHGFLSAWITAKSLLQIKDSLAVAGDLFDTRYGSYSDPDFAPQEINKQIPLLKNPLFYTYGNCDVEGFSPGFKHFLLFQYNGKKIFLHHGHRPITINTADALGVDIIIQGHTHLCSLEKRNGMILMNPGSLALPRNNLYTYGVLEDNLIRLVDFKTGDSLVSLSI